MNINCHEILFWEPCYAISFWYFECPFMSKLATASFGIVLLLRFVKRLFPVRNFGKKNAEFLPILFQTCLAWWPTFFRWRLCYAAFLPPFFQTPCIIYSGRNAQLSRQMHSSAPVDHVTCLDGVRGLRHFLFLVVNDPDKSPENKKPRKPHGS